MKKSTTKSAAKTPAPAKKAPAKSVKKVVAALTKSMAKPTKTPKTSPAATKAKAPAKSAPSVKKTAAASTVTRITAAIDVGFGNSLYLRGEGGGLSWEKGVLLDCVADDSWTISLTESSSKPIECKFLLNDVAWCVGNDYIVPVGSSVVLKPTF